MEKMPRNPHKIERRVLLLYFVPFRHVLLLCYEIAIAFHFMCGFVAMVAKLEYLFLQIRPKAMYYLKPALTRTSLQVTITHKITIFLLHPSMARRE